MSLLEAKALRYGFRSTRVLDDISLAVTNGEAVAVVGPSGCGKSTLLHCLAGLLQPQEGEVVFDGHRIDVMSERARSELRLRSFGFVFQFGELVPELTVVENVELPLRLVGLSARRSRPRALAMLERLGVEDCAPSRFTEISGGQAQRVAVARALVHGPRFVFADEPTGSLDDQNTFVVLSLLLDLAKENGSGVVIVTHDMQVATRADRYLLLRSGTLREAVAA